MQAKHPLCRRIYKKNLHPSLSGCKCLNINVLKRWRIAETLHHPSRPFTFCLTPAYSCCHYRQNGQIQNRKRFSVKLFVRSRDYPSEEVWRVVKGQSNPSLEYLTEIQWLMPQKWRVKGFWQYSSAFIGFLSKIIGIL